MTFLRRFLSPVATFSFIAIFITQSSLIYAAQGNLLNLPAPGKMISLSPKFVSAFVKGISIYPNDPFKFDFIIDTGDAKLNDQQFKEESNKLIKYFMAALTVPEKEDWVNLSPYEKDRIIPESLGITDMGRDMLAQDYFLKQLTSSLIYPEKEIGKEFWSKVYAQAQKQFGTTNILVNTFNKVWIVPSQAVVWEHDNSAYVVRSHLKVMLEQDYLSLNKHLNNNIFNGSGMDQQDAQTTNTVGSNVVREGVLPALEREVNEGANFATLRQVFNSAILAAWYKQNLKETILGQVYANQDKVTGVDLADKQIKQKIYERYLQAFKKGAFNFIKEDNDPLTHQSVPRKYFSGGVTNLAMMTDVEKGDFAQLPAADQVTIVAGRYNLVTIDMAQAGANQAMPGETPSLGISSEELASRINLELQSPDKGNQIIPVIAAISDQHGTIDKFDQLLVHILRSVPAGQRIPQDFVLQPYQSLTGQLSDLGISLKDFKDQLFIHNLGDLMDRGPSGVGVYMRSRELIDGGISDFIDGNHDQWMFMNLLGFHLPTYDNFNFYGYKDEYDATNGNVKDLLEQKHKTDPNTRQPLWWAEKLAEFRSFQDDQQKNHWKPTVARVKELTEQLTEGMSKDEKNEWYFSKLGRIWGKLQGYNPDVGGDVQTGVRAVGLVSIKWWEGLLGEFRSELSQPGLAGPKGKIWSQAVDIMGQQIIPTLKKDLEREINGEQTTGAQKKKWWWRIFEAINYKNNDSPEWWAQDWVYHAGWGDSVLKEINAIEHGGHAVVTTANYLNDPILKAIAKFYQENYTLHIRDIFQTDYMHAFLPVDPNTGEFYFTYKGIEYRGNGQNGVPSYREGLDIIAQDVRNASVDQGFNPDIYEALSLVNSWYADETTIAKPSHVADALTNVGAKKVAIANGISRLFTGHIPLHDFQKLSQAARAIITGFLVSTDDQQHFIFTDHGMGQRFLGGGKYVEQGPAGLHLVGYADRNSNKIERDPPTVIIGGNDEVSVVHEQNTPIEGDAFLPAVLRDIQANSRVMTSPRVADAAQISVVNRNKILKKVKIEYSYLGDLRKAYWGAKIRYNDTVISADGELVSQSVSDYLGTRHELPDDKLKKIIVETDAAQVSKLDQASVAQRTTFNPEGGINLDANLYNMQVLRDGKGMVLPVSQQPIGQFMKIKGFKPVFLNIERNINLPARLGVNFDKLPKEQLAQASSVNG